jgi:hypothetical protein
MSIPKSITLIAQEKLSALQSLYTDQSNMKTYEKLARFIELNDDGPQSCLNTTFTQDHKRKIPSWSINMDMKAYIIEP